MTVAEFVTAVRNTTGHDSDTQVTDPMITAEGDRRYKSLRRWLSQKAPELYQTTSETTLTTGTNTISKPSDFERVIRVEIQLSQGFWEPLAMRNALSQTQGIACDSAGTYRLTYVTKPTSGYTSFDVPDGAEEILIHETAGWVRQRHEEDPSYHMAEARQLKLDLQRDIAMRNGAHPRSVLVSGGLCDYRSWYEEGDYIVIQ